jgi:DNA-binding response OmpR family regulator
VDDDANILRLVELYLTKEGYAVETAADGAKALKQFRDNPPSLVLLDVLLPSMDGWQVLREIRKSANIPIIMLTAKDETFDKVLGLELGADDYIVKPFEPKEMLARVKAVLRRSGLGANDASSKEVSFPGLTVNLTRYTVSFAGNTIEMPPKELEVLYFLAEHPNQVFTREQLIEQVWGYEFFGENRTVDVHVMRVREKLQDSERFGWTIKTVWRVGYKFEVKQL